MPEQRFVPLSTFRSEDLVKDQFIDLIAEQFVSESGGIAVGLFAEPLNRLFGQGGEAFGTQTPLTGQEQFPIVGGKRVIHRGRG